MSAQATDPIVEVVHRDEEDVGLFRRCDGSHTEEDAGGDEGSDGVHVNGLAEQGSHAMLV